MLEIGTKSLVLELVSPLRPATIRPAAATTESSTDGDNNLPDQKKGGAQSTSPLAGFQQVTTSSREKVLEMNGQLQSITLTRDNQLRLISSTSGPLIVNELAKVSQISGTLDENLE